MESFIIRMFCLIFSIISTHIAFVFSRCPLTNPFWLLRLIRRPLLFLAMRISRVIGFAGLVRLSWFCRPDFFLSEIHFFGMAFLHLFSLQPEVKSPSSLILRFSSRGSMGTSGIVTFLCNDVEPRGFCWCFSISFEAIELICVPATEVNLVEFICLYQSNIITTLLARQFGLQSCEKIAGHSSSLWSTSTALKLCSPTAYHNS